MRCLVDIDLISGWCRTNLRQSDPDGLLWLGPRLCRTGPRAADNDLLAGRRPHDRATQETLKKIVLNLSSDTEVEYN